MADQEAVIAQLGAQMRASPELRATGRTLRVPSEFATIALALAAAQFGDQVLVSAGFYPECLVLVDGVTLAGELVDGSPAATLYGVGCSCTGVICADESIEHGATVKAFRILAASDNENGVYLRGSKGVHVADVVVSTPRGAGILADAAARLFVGHSRIEGAGGMGVTLSNGATAELVDLDIVASFGQGVRSQQSSFVLEKSRLVANGGVGSVHLQRASRALLMGNDIQGQRAAVLVSAGQPGSPLEPSSAWLVNNFIHSSGFVGLQVSQSEAFAFGNRYESNEDGVLVQTGGSYFGRGELMLHNRIDGLVAIGCPPPPATPPGPTRVTVERSTVVENGQEGMFATCGTTVKVRESTFSKNRIGLWLASTWNFGGGNVGSAQSDLDARRTVFADNAQFGVRADASLMMLGTIDDPGQNSFLRNVLGAIWNDSPNVVPAQWNWFGTTDANAIASSITDCNDDPNFGCVQFVPFLKRAPSPPPGFWPPAGTVGVNFSVDDSANRVYGPGDLQWKGSFSFDPLTRLLTFDPFWSAGVDGWPALYDDGPWTEGGHEPIGARAGDHLWGVTVFVTPPPAGSQTYEYGVIDVLYETTLGNGWIWKGHNGSFAVDSGARAAITASGMSVEKFGHTDLQFLLDTTKLAQFAGWTWDTSRVTVKSSAWGWGELAMQDVGAGLRSFQLSEFVGKHNLLVHTGLLNPGDQPEFVFIIGGVEYRNWWGDLRVLADGVTASIGPQGGHHYTPVPIWWTDTLNTAITVPGHHD
ncbi:MAG TPA: right-handed parallel beta-helix repeat-containing protein [Myxococcaceae bacterium]|nr:right-handed parallel beta-helix repeat-containing protein [Myxococcaceae bacterium]